MAEFQEVMRQFNRLCEAQIDCDQCPVDKVGCCGNFAALKESELIEKAVMSWAAEHPEPVYPTWAQYFNRIRINNGCKPLLTDAELLKVVCTPIPADIAQKLGIEPKEDIC